MLVTPLSRASPFFFLSLIVTPPSLSWHADVRLWALCPITLTCDRWSSRAGAKGKIYRRKRRDFLRDWGQEERYYISLITFVTFVSRENTLIFKYHHRIFSLSPSPSPPPPPPPTPALNFGLTSRLVLPRGSFTSRVFRSSFSSCNFIWWKPREKPGAKLLSSSLAPRPSENLSSVRLSARKKIFRIEILFPFDYGLSCAFSRTRL